MVRLENCILKILCCDKFYFERLIFVFTQETVRSILNVKMIVLVMV